MFRKTNIYYRLICTRTHTYWFFYGVIIPSIPNNMFHFLVFKTYTKKEEFSSTSTFFNLTEIELYKFYPLYSPVIYCKQCRWDAEVRGQTMSWGAVVWWLLILQNFILLILNSGSVQAQILAMVRISDNGLNW